MSAAGPAAVRLHLDDEADPAAAQAEVSQAGDRDAVISSESEATASAADFVSEAGSDEPVVLERVQKRRRRAASRREGEVRAAAASSYRPTTSFGTGVSSSIYNPTTVWAGPNIAIVRREDLTAPGLSRQGIEN